MPTLVSQRHAQSLLFGIRNHFPQSVLIVVCSFMCLTTILLEFPISIVKRADLTGLKPTGNAMEMECVITDAPSHRTLLTGCRSLVCLTFNAEIHDMVSADSAVVYNNIPSPQSHRIPLLNLEAFLTIGSGIRSSCLDFSGSLFHWCGGSRRSVCHIDVCHNEWWLERKWRRRKLCNRLWRGTFRHHTLLDSSEAGLKSMNRICSLDPTMERYLKFIGDSRRT